MKYIALDVLILLFFFLSAETLFYIIELQHFGSGLSFCNGKKKSIRNWKNKSGLRLYTTLGNGFAILPHVGLSVDLLPLKSLIPKFRL